VAASAELTDDLRRGRRVVEGLAPEVAIIRDWTPAPDGSRRWQLTLELHPTGLGSVHPVAASTRWVLLADATYPRGAIQVFPAKEGGITVTFPHQLANGYGDPDMPWRSGLICLVDTINGHANAMATLDPADAVSRLAWWVWRALEWLRAASRGELLKPGEPFELPVFGQQSSTKPILAFREGPAQLATWQSAPRSGLADLVPVSDGRYALAVRSFRSLAVRDVARPEWAGVLRDAKDGRKGGWVRFDALPVIAPWQAPTTWGELVELARAEGWDMVAELRGVTAALRDGRSHLLLVGFPVPRLFDGADDTQYWMAVKLPVLTATKAAKTPMPGFRTQNAGWYADRKLGVLHDDARLDWVRTENWHPDELGNRGRYDGGLRSANVALIGAGALGSMLASHLVRAGVARLDIIDPGILEAGNVVRHILTLNELGQSKAMAVAERLAEASPNVTVTGHLDMFAPDLEATGNALRAADVIIDATADDAVLSAMGAYDWAGDKRFVSIALSYAAEHLYAYFVDGRTFPADECEAALRPWIDRLTKGPEELPWEGIGCWHSVFPARADDIGLLAATASRLIDDRLRTSVSAPELAVFERTKDGIARAPALQSP
jgi:hypothetical protein